MARTQWTALGRVAATASAFHADREALTLSREALVREVCDALDAGTPEDMVARCAGVAPLTIREWHRKAGSYEPA